MATEVSTVAEFTGFVNQVEKEGRKYAYCQCGNDKWTVVYGEFYCGGICTACCRESELYSG